MPHLRSLLLLPRRAVTVTSDSQEGGEEFTHSLMQSFLHMMDTPQSLRAMCQASPVPAPWSHAVDKTRLSSYPCGACKVVKVRFRGWGSRKSITEGWEEEGLARRRT